MQSIFNTTFIKEWGLLCCAHNILKKMSWDRSPEQLKIKEQNIHIRGEKKQKIAA